jgi:hypothetical protein
MLEAAMIEIRRILAQSTSRTTREERSITPSQSPDGTSRRSPRSTYFRRLSTRLTVPVRLSLSRLC